MNQPAPELIRCALCGKPVIACAHDPALQGPVGRCCHEDLRNAEDALCKAELMRVTLNPAHEK